MYILNLWFYNRIDNRRVIQKLFDSMKKSYVYSLCKISKVSDLEISIVINIGQGRDNYLEEILIDAIQGALNLGTGTGGRMGNYKLMDFSSGKTAREGYISEPGLEDLLMPIETMNRRMAQNSRGLPTSK